MSKMAIDSPYKGSGQITRQQYLFYEMRVTARLMQQKMNDKEIINTIAKDNLYQYPTERTISQIARGCVQRLNALDSDELVSAIACRDTTTAKQICVYAMMKQYRLIWDFMITVIGEKFRQQDYTYKRSDIIAFMYRLQEQDDVVASWSEETIKRIAQVIAKMLIEAEYIDDAKSTHLNSVLICRDLEENIRRSGDAHALIAFNCLN